MRFKLYSALLIAATLTACSDNQTKVFGYYSYKNELNGRERIAEVRKDGDSYLFIENALDNEHALALQKSTDGLSYQGAALTVSEDGSKLYFGPIHGTRVDKSYVEAARAKMEQDRKACDALQEEVTANAKALEAPAWNAYVRTLPGKTPKGCQLKGAGMRW